MRKKAAVNICIILITLFLAFTTGTIKAQTHYSSNVSIGAKGGLDISKVFFSPSVKQKMTLGMNTGVMVRYVEENHFGLIGELNFAQRGLAENFEEAPYSYSRTLIYVDLCFLAHVFFVRRGRFFFNAGPQVGYYLGETVKSNFDPYNTADLPDFPNKNRINYQLTEPTKIKIDYGISAGLGTEFFINPRNSISLEGRFYFGLANIFSTKRQDNFGAANQMTISASLGYWFRVK